MIISQDFKEAVFMEKYITDEHTGLRYELVGDYYIIAGDYDMFHFPFPFIPT